MSIGFPTFYEWITQDEDRKQDFAYTAVNSLDTFGMTDEAFKIIRAHAGNAAYDFSYNTDPEDINEDTAETFMEDYGYEVFSGPTRAALIHWAWNSDMDLTEFGPLSGDNIWTQIEHITWHQIDSATRHALTEYADKYAEAREEWEDGQED